MDTAFAPPMGRDPNDPIQPSTPYRQTPPTSNRLPTVMCPSCEAVFNVQPNVASTTCSYCGQSFYCGTPQPLPNVGEKDDEVLSNGGTQFSTGAVRSADKQGVQYHLISPIGMRRLAETHREGTDKYGFFNWERGMPIGDLLNHAIAHIYAFLSGVPSVDAKTGKVEDDLAHAAWNLFAAMHMQETMPELDHQLRFKLPPKPLTDEEINDLMQESIEKIFGPAKEWTDPVVPWTPKPGDVVAKASDPHTPVGVIPPYAPVLKDGCYVPPEYREQVAKDISEPSLSIQQVADIALKNGVTYATITNILKDIDKALT